MITSLEYKASVWCEDYPEEDWSGPYHKDITIELQDIIEYIFKEAYGKDYNPLSWYLEDGAKELVYDIEDSWWRDDIDVYNLLKDTNLYNFLKDKYREDVINDIYTNHYNLLRDEYQVDNSWNINIEYEVE